MNKMKVLLLLSLVASPLAIAQDQSDEAAQEDDGEERVCIYSRNVRTFDAIDDQHIYVREGSDKHYLLTMKNRCFNLRSALGIAFKDTSSRTCSDGFGEIVYRDRMGGPGRRQESCRIGTIERVESKDDAEAIVDARKEADN
jgi:hypothetical protein